MRLATHGVKSAALTMPGSNPPEECPDWLVKWAALVLEYVELEKELLPEALMEKPLDGIVYDRGFAEATAAGVVATRVQNLVITLDKIKYVLRQEGQCREPFLRTIGEEEIIEHLWDGTNGILRRAVDAFAGAVNQGAGNRPNRRAARVVTDEAKTARSSRRTAAERTRARVCRRLRRCWRTFGVCWRPDRRRRRRPGRVSRLPRGAFARWGGRTSRWRTRFSCTRGRRRG